MRTHVVFDFDGTIADSGRAILSVFNTLADRHGFQRMSRNNLESLRQLSIRERVVAMGVPAWKLPFLVVEATRLLRASMHQIGFNPGMKELLDELRQRGLTVAIVSSNAEENIRAFLQHHQAESLVDRIVCSSRLFGKAALLRKVMKEERLQPDALVYVGDETRDIEACREVDVQVIGVTWGFDSAQLLTDAKPDLLAKEPVDIVRWVMANGAAGHASAREGS